MGSDKHKKHKKRKHSDSDEASSSSSSGSSSSEDRKAKKHKKEKKERKHKKHHKHKSSDKSADKELVKQAKEFLKQKLAGADAPAGAVATVGPHLSTANDGDGPQLMPPPPPRPPRPAVAVKEPITSAAYFERHVEFTAWLLEAKRLYFNELSTEDARQEFEGFVEQWNAGQLDGRYYAGQVEAPKRRTQHVWSFAKGAKDGAGVAKGPIGVAAFMAEQQDQRDSKRASDQLDRRKERRDRELLLDEVLPKATGREAQVEKRVARREDARARAASPDAHVPGGRGDLMGGDDSFAAAKARESQQQQFRQGKQTARSAELNVKLVAFQAAEDAKMEQFRKLAAQGPITIAKRQPPPG